MNRVVISGIVVGPPTQRNADSGTRILSFQVQSRESFKNKGGSFEIRDTLHSVVAFGYLAEVNYGRVNQGSEVLVDGALASRKDRSGGFNVDVAAKSIEVFGTGDPTVEV